jgi:hypothetical protein
MRGEAEIRQKIEGYEAMLAGIEVGKSIDTPVFLAVSQYFPREAMEMVSTSSAADELTQGMVRQLVLCQFARQVLESRISILRWVLEDEAECPG